MDGGEIGLSCAEGRAGAGRQHDQKVSRQHGQKVARAFLDVCSWALPPLANRRRMLCKSQAAAGAGITPHALLAHLHHKLLASRQCAEQLGHQQAQGRVDARASWHRRCCRGAGGVGGKGGKVNIAQGAKLNSTGCALCACAGVSARCSGQRKIRQCWAVRKTNHQLMECQAPAGCKAHGCFSAHQPAFQSIHFAAAAAAVWHPRRAACAVSRGLAMRQRQGSNDSIQSWTARRVSVHPPAHLQTGPGGPAASAGDRAHQPAGQHPVQRKKQAGRSENQVAGKTTQSRRPCILKAAALLDVCQRLNHPLAPPDPTTPPLLSTCR